MGKPGGNKMALHSSVVYPWSIMWFFAALCVITGSVISCASEIISLEWIDALEMAYLFFFGILLAVVDTPLFTSVALVTHVHQTVNRFIAILTRVTGKGVVYMFLGCTLFSSMWSNLEGALMLFLAFFLGITIFLVGMISVLLGFMKSRNLNQVRSALNKEPQLLPQKYSQFARTNPNTGLTPDEFEKLSISLPQQVRFEGNDMKFVFGGLSTDPSRMFISLDDLTQWVTGGMIFI